MWPIKGDKGTKKNEFRRMETGMYGSLILLEKNTHTHIQSWYKHFLHQDIEYENFFENRWLSVTRISFVSNNLINIWKANKDHSWISHLSWIFL